MWLTVRPVPPGLAPVLWSPGGWQGGRCHAVPPFAALGDATFGSPLVDQMSRHCWNFDGRRSQSMGKAQARKRKEPDKAFQKPGDALRQTLKVHGSYWQWGQGAIEEDKVRWYECIVPPNVDFYTS